MAFKKNNNYKIIIKNLSQKNEMLNAAIESKNLEIENLKLSLKNNYNLYKKELDLLKHELNNYKKIKEKAECEALKIIENAQTKALDSTYIIDDIFNEVKIFKADIKNIKEDVNKDTYIMENRILELEQKLAVHLNTLKLIKTQFYNKNKLPDCNNYEYISVAKAKIISNK